MTWEEIIKLRVGPQKEEDARRFAEMYSEDKETRERADKETVKEYDRFVREVRDLATTLASLIARGGVKITNEAGQPVKSINKVLADMMDKIAESYEYMFGDVDRGNTRTQAEAMAGGNEMMRNTAAKLRETADKLR